MIAPRATPTFSELVDWLQKEFGCDCRQLPGSETPPVWEIQREVGGELLYYPVVVEWQDWPVEPSLIRSICRRLQVDPHHILGDWTPEDEF